MSVHLKRQRWVCLMLAFLTSFAFCIVNDNYVIPPELELQLANKLSVIMWQISCAMAQPGYGGSIAVVLLYFAYRYLWNKLDRKIFKWSIPFSLIMSFVLLLCESYYQYNSWDKVFGGRVSFVLSAIRGMGIAVPIFFLFHVICSWRIEVQDNTGDITWKAQLASVAILLLCWLPYIIIMFPGNFCPDAADEIAQITGNREYCWTIKTIVADSSGSLWNNHHPVFYTWILSLVIKLGELIGTQTGAFIIYTVLQCICLAMTVVYFLCMTCRWGISIKIRRYILMFFALNPLFPLWGVTVTKDIFFSMVLLICVLQFYEFLKFPEKFSIKRKLVFAIWLLLLMLLRNNGFYMLIGILPFIVWYFRKSKKQLIQVILTVLVPMIFYQIGVQGILFSVLQIPAGSPREMLSVPFQQTGRYIEEYGADLEEDEISAIEAILGRNGETYMEIGAGYVPDHADKIKNRFLPGADGEILKNYMKAWVKGLTKHPDAYVEAFLNLQYSWFYYDSRQDFHYYYEDTYGLRTTEERITDMLGEMGRIPGFHSMCSNISYMIDLLAKVPFLSWMLEFSFYTWTYVVCMLVMLIRRRFCELLASGMLFINYAICFIGPVAYTRYAVPMMVCVLFVIILTFTGDKRKEMVIRKCRKNR